MKNIKSEKGIITMLVLISVLFLVTFLISAYLLISNKLQNQEEVVAETKRIYEGTSTMEEVYDSLYNDMYLSNIYIKDIVIEKIGEKQYIAPIPLGYVASKATGEDKISTGLVIYEGNDEVNNDNVQQARSTRNQFVWIPVETDFMQTYVGANNCLEPGILSAIDAETKFSYDSQEELDYYYGKNYYNYEEDFSYNTHYKEMVESVNKYNGFYIGRYETTIDKENNIGSKENATVLAENIILKEGTNPNDNKPYYYRWHGQYNALRKCNLTGNGRYLQVNMIWGQNWDAMISYFEKIGQDYSNWGLSIQGKPVNSAQSTLENGTNDKICNIYDLRTNLHEATAEVASTGGGHIFRGGWFGRNLTASNRYSPLAPTATTVGRGTRILLYIK